MNNLTSKTKNEKEKDMSLFEIPCCERIINVGSIYRLSKKTETMHVDSVDFFLHYDEEWQKNDRNFIRSHLQQRVEGNAYIEAENVREAIKKFYDECEGAKIGGPGKSEKAIWINDEKFIHELPRCPKMRKNKGGQFVCSINEDDEDCDDDWNRMCILENYEPPSNCVIATFQKCVRDYGKTELIRAARDIDGHKFIELRTLIPF
ncbi:MAG: hypothetical protein KGJ58_03775 [Patescibacteria group bacterium]|nr:hypothetical protein [Patescibacteria group bacterium]MDE1988445.1 hypothetical protein [Patescibacteria group bacterium]MDE2218542.1 hypothetical protein [Patescibacteria group bacterium]